MQIGVIQLNPRYYWLASGIYIYRRFNRFNNPKFVEKYNYYNVQMYVHILDLFKGRMNVCTICSTFYIIDSLYLIIKFTLLIAFRHKYFFCEYTDCKFEIYDKY